MKLTNSKTKQEIETNNKSLIARSIGVSRPTIYAWVRKGVTQEYNHWTLEFD